MKTIKLILLIATLIISSIFSCDKGYESPPQLPPLSSFLQNFSDFNNYKAEGDSTNWKFAAESVAAWNTLILGLEVPIASYTEALNKHSPIYQSDNTWLWEYSFTDKRNNIYTAKLYGKLSSEMVDWEMYISKEETFLNFPWYTGISMVDESQVFWILKDSPNNATKKISVEYNKTPENTFEIKHTNIIPDDSQNGSYIISGENNNTDWNAYFYIYKNGIDNLTEIEWNKNLKNGRVKDENKFKNDDWQCWDEFMQDITCE